MSHPCTKRLPETATGGENVAPWSTERETSQTAPSPTSRSSLRNWGVAFWGTASFSRTTSPLTMSTFATEPGAEPFSSAYAAGLLGSSPPLESTKASAPAIRTTPSAAPTRIGVRRFDGVAVGSIA